MKKHSKKLYLLLLIAIFISLSLFKSPSNVIYAAGLMQSGPTYIVQPGDTLNSIALRFGISSEEIQSANGLTDPNAIAINQRLIIPGLEGISGLLTSETLPYGTSLTGLTRQYRLQETDLMTLNRLSSPSETIAGLTFIVPIDETQNPLSPVGRVFQSETTLEWAAKNGESPWETIENNQLLGSWDIIPGEILYGSREGDNGELPLNELPSITVNNIPIIQGETLEIDVTSLSGTEINGEFNGEPLHFFSDDGEQYYSFHGIYALSDPGAYPLTIQIVLEDGRSYHYQQLTLLKSGDYGNEWVSVPPGYLDEEKIAEEDALINPIINQYTSDRYWDGQFQYPVDEPCLRSGFGQRRDYNNGGLFFYHTGADFGPCAPNLNIYAAASGEVMIAEELFVKGNAVIIDHGWGVFSMYCHLSEIDVSVGDVVQQGDLIGQMGNTGRSQGSHLHFEINISGTPVNPMTWLSQAFP